MKILITEDGKRLATTIQSSFKKRGHRVDVLHDSVETKERLQKSPNEYKLIILDLILPKHTGEKLATEIRKMGIATPILLLTTAGDVHEKIGFLSDGVEYMEKPFSFSEFEKRVEDILKSPHDKLPVELHSPEGTIMLDRKSHMITIYDAQVPLTFKEFVLLEYFLRHPDTVITRNDLMQHVWNSNFSTSSNVLDVHVKNLRKKLITARTKARIETVHGVGYRFIG
jgi:DNA-binding response OmpR family regulator